MNDTKKGGGAIVCLFHSIVCVFIEVTRICIEWEFRVLAQFLTHLLFEMKRGYYADNRGAGEMRVTYIFFVVLVTYYTCVNVCVSLSQFCRVFFSFTCC